jgi:hypothetical protein
VAKRAGDRWRAGLSQGETNIALERLVIAH